MNAPTDRQTLRDRIWKELRRVALPDSRFHDDFNDFIPDFFGSALCAEALAGHDSFRRATLIMATPDNSIRAVREHALARGHKLLMPSYRLGRGFLLIDPDEVPRGQETLASTLDGAELFARPATYDDVAPHAPLSLLVAGACGVTVEGVRVHDGPNYFDLEWGLLRQLRLVDDYSCVAICVHEVQVVREFLPPEPWEVVADLIVTPTLLSTVSSPYRKPTRMRAESFPTGLVAQTLASLNATA